MDQKCLGLQQLKLEIERLKNENLALKMRLGVGRAARGPVGEGSRAVRPAKTPCRPGRAPPHT